jgi:hypothetical protein
MMTPIAIREYYGSLRITSQVGPPPVRARYENLLYPSIEVGLLGWERAHSQGAGTGQEHAQGICYTPQGVHQQPQNQGIERLIRELYQEKAEAVELFLTTETKCLPGTRRLKSIICMLEAQRNHQKIRLWEAEITVEDKRVAPRVGISATPDSSVEPFLKPPGRRKHPVLPLVRHAG